MRCPRQAISPESGSTSFRIAFAVDDLPQPLLAHQAQRLALGDAKLTSSAACTWPLTRPKTPLRTG